MSGATGTIRPGLLGRLFVPRPLRWSLVELCRRTTHAGWESLQTAEAAGRGVALVTSPGTPWPVAARAVAAWAGPLHLALPEAAAERKLARLVCTSDAESPRLAPDPDATARALAAGDKVLFVIEDAGPRDLVPHPIPEGTAILPLRVESPSRGRYRLVIGPAGS